MFHLNCFGCKNRTACLPVRSTVSLNVRKAFWKYTNLVFQMSFIVNGNGEATMLCFSLFHFIFQLDFFIFTYILLIDGPPLQWYPHSGMLPRLKGSPPIQFWGSGRRPFLYACWLLEILPIPFQSFLIISYCCSYYWIQKCKHTSHPDISEAIQNSIQLKIITIRLEYYVPYVTTKYVCDWCLDKICLSSDRRFVTWADLFPFVLAAFTLFFLFLLFVYKLGLWAIGNCFSHTEDKEGHGHPCLGSPHNERGRIILFCFVLKWAPKKLSVQNKTLAFSKQMVLFKGCISSGTNDGVSYRWDWSSG